MEEMEECEMDFMLKNWKGSKMERGKTKKKCIIKW